MKKLRGQIKVPRRYQILVALGVVLAGLIICGNSFGLMFGDPGTPEAAGFKSRWSGLAFWLGCPFGVYLIFLGARALLRTAERS